MLLLFYASALLIACRVVDAKTATQLQCRDENDAPVDWYVLYKLPKIAQSSIPSIRNGTAYLFITDKTANVGWQLSAKNIGDSRSTPGNTLAPLYNGNVNATLWTLYSDSPPDAPSQPKYGHTKGVVMADEKQGLWLIHSVPNFPSYPNGGVQPRKRFNSENSSHDEGLIDGRYGYPHSGLLNGQSFLCISLGREQFDVVGKQLMYNQIIVYNRNIPSYLGENYPVLRDAANQVRVRDPPYKSKAMIRSLGTLEFTSFAKSDKWQRDLYDDFVAPQLQSDLMVQTWLNGRGRLPTDCAGAKVYNVESLVLAAANVVFPSTRDHSKWAVTVENRSNRSWICVGDINRADTQYSRGGGTVCFKIFNVWRNYRNSVNDVEPCPRRNG